jgi:hypothetical protein
MIAFRRQWLFRCCAVFFAAALSLWCTPVRAQEVHITTLRGQVLNSVTKEPVARALVTVMGQYAMFTDDQGRYEFQLRGKGMAVAAGQSGATFSSAPGFMGSTGIAYVSRMVTARKPGYLDSLRTATSAERRRLTQEAQSDVIIYLVPEALIVGHVEVPGTEGEVRIECELYRKQMREGRQTWTSSGIATSWANGEFRFSSLEAGTYKLITHEQMDRDSMARIPGAPLFGYPPVYYPNTTDFSAAGEIVVKAGETTQVNLTVARHPYYPVRLETRNAPVGQPIGLSVWPMGHWGPGWSLGYNPSEQTIEGLLPNGNYTVEANSQGEPSNTGIGNFSVKGRPADGPGLMFVTNPPITVTVHQEFHAAPSANGASDGAVANARANAANLHIVLSSLDDFNQPHDAVSRPLEGSQGREYTISNVRPGRYQVNVNMMGGGYAAAIESGGKDLMHEPLVVGLGAAVPPIEITVRDDGAEVDGTVNESSGGDANSSQNQDTQNPRMVYLLPAAGAQPRVIFSRANGKFAFTQVPPGDYLVLAFTEQQRDLENTNDAVTQKLQDQGQVLHLEAGQKVNVTLNVIERSAE